MENSPNIGVCFSHAQFIDEKGNIYSDSDDVDCYINILINLIGHRECVFSIFLNILCSQWAGINRNIENA